MTALVTGATGFLGSGLVRRLLDGGEPVRVLARSEHRARALAERGAEVVVGEITDVAALAEAVRGADVVYHLAGRLLEPGVQPAEYRRTHVEGTQLLLERCRRSPALQRFVHVSTTGVLGATGVHPADESAPLHPTNVYETTKAHAELAVRDAARDWLPAVIARPGLVYGPGDLHLLGFFRAVLRRRFRPIGRRTVWLHPIYIDDMVEALLRCGERDGAAGECFHLAGRDPVRLDDLASAIAAAGGTSVPAGHIPLPAARAAAAVGDRLPAGVRRSAPLTRTRLEFLTHSRVYDVTKARRLLGFEAATDLSAGTQLSMAWYRAHGHLPAGA
ncbi:MAG TPA: NAD-dependent epimerase/dehydratase family protein [Thermoleophilaceae bacterium]|nr:NAD-dependent epimerase/dehydratase family protein [Thermoleophilaceae bacterium]